MKGEDKAAIVQAVIHDHYRMEAEALLKLVVDLQYRNALLQREVNQMQLTMNTLYNERNVRRRLEFEEEYNQEEEEDFMLELLFGE
jgi:hypothetical protein